MQKARRHPSEDRLRPLVSARFQVLLTSLIGVLFNIRSTYWFAIGRQVVFSLGGWTPQLHVGFHEPGATLVRLDQFLKPLQDYHLLWLGFHSPFTVKSIMPHWRPQPRPEGRFGQSSDFARRY